ncbi:MAG: hypothetical protein IJ507_02325 [Clostridia bacterium]|nr:hypothetical protein [Clostridia bacterium]
MPKNHASLAKTASFLCAALLIILVALQFTPFWTYGETGENSASIAGYVWFPGDHAALTTHLQSVLGADFTLGSILVSPILMLVLGVIGAVLSVWKAGELLPALISGTCGVAGVAGFLSRQALRLGSGWALQLTLCVLILAASCFILHQNWKMTVSTSDSAA